MSLNGKTCWTKAGVVGRVGTQQCGGIFKEEMFRVTGCYVTLSGSQVLTVRVWTNLDGDAADESFGIDNVFIQKGIAERIAVNIYMRLPFTRAFL